MEENQLESKEIEIIVCLLDQLIDSSVPRKAEYYRGYREGIRLIGIVGEEPLKGFICIKGMDRSGDPYLENYIRGFNDGCTFHLPDSLENLLGSVSAS
jgi:hypothetical protein